MDNKKEFWVEVSFSGRIKMIVDADNEDIAKEKVFDNIQANFNTGEDNNIQIEEIEWDLIEKERGGNIREPYISNMYIEEME